MPSEALQFSGGLEIDWKTFAGDLDTTLTNVLILRAIVEEGVPSASAVRKVLHAHLHRGLGYLSSDPNSLDPGNVIAARAER